MIDFKNASFVKMQQVSDSTYASNLQQILLPGEAILATFKAMRDGVVFTDKRIIALNIQGITGKKIDFTSLPYSKIQAYSVETAGVMDLDCELELWFSGLGLVKFEFVGKSDIAQICRTISMRVL